MEFLTFCVSFSDPRKSFGQKLIVLDDVAQTYATEIIDALFLHFEKKYLKMKAAENTEKNISNPLKEAFEERLKELIVKEPKRISYHIGMYHVGTICVRFRGFFKGNK